jgi:ribosomal protein L29
MKRNDIKALATKSVAELHKMLHELQVALAQARMAKAARKPLPGGLPSAISDDIARVKVTLTEKELAAATAPQAEEPKAAKTKKKVKAE